jgi:vitamin B12 transporter
LVLKDLTTNSELLQRPRNKAVLSLVYADMAQFEAEARVFLVGSRIDFCPVRLAPYARLELIISYKISDTVALFARAENLTHARYEEVFNYAAAGSLYAGVRVTW